MQYPVYYIDEYGNTFPLVKTIEEDNQKILYFSNLYSDSDVTDVYDTYISSTHITVDAPSGSDCNITTNSNETDLGSVINDVVSNYPIPIILVKGQTYSKYAVFNDTRDFTKGLKTNNIFLSVDNQLVPLSGFTATTSSYAKLYFVSVPVDNNLAGAATVFSMGCTSSSSSVLVDKITTR